MLLKLHERDAAKLLEEMAEELGMQLHEGNRGSALLPQADGSPADMAQLGELDAASDVMRTG